MKFDLEMERNGILVLFVVVFVRSVFFVFGGLMRSVLWGIFVFRVLYFFGFFKKLINFIISRFVSS